MNIIKILTYLNYQMFLVTKRPLTYWTHIHYLHQNEAFWSSKNHNKFYDTLKINIFIYARRKKRTNLFADVIKSKVTWNISKTNFLFKYEFKFRFSWTARIFFNFVTMKASFVDNLIRKWIAITSQVTLWYYTPKSVIFIQFSKIF